MENKHLEEFKLMLKNHDKYYNMSSDGRTYNRGLEQEKEINEFVKKFPELEEVLKDFYKGW